MKTFSVQKELNRLRDFVVGGLAFTACNALSTSVLADPISPQTNFVIAKNSAHGVATIVNKQLCYQGTIGKRSPFDGCINMFAGPLDFQPFNVVASQGIPFGWTELARFVVADNTEYLDSSGDFFDRGPIAFFVTAMGQPDQTTDPTAVFFPFLKMSSTSSNNIKAIQQAGGSLQTFDDTQGGALLAFSLKKLAYRPEPSKPGTFFPLVDFLDINQAWKYAPHWPETTLNVPIVRGVTFQPDDKVTTTPIIENGTSVGLTFKIASSVGLYEVACDEIFHFNKKLGLLQPQEPFCVQIPHGLPTPKAY